MRSFDALLEATRPRAYRRDGTPYASFEEWSADFQRSHLDRVVAQTDVFPGILVSTVWLGLDHAWLGGPPLIFETMVFGGPLDMEQDRYSTEEQALVGHAAMLSRVRWARWNLRGWWRQVAWRRVFQRIRWNLRRRMRRMRRMRRG